MYSSLLQMFSSTSNQTFLQTDVLHQSEEQSDFRARLVGWILSFGHVSQHSTRARQYHDVMQLVHIMHVFIVGL